MLGFVFTSAANAKDLWEFLPEDDVWYKDTKKSAMIITQEAGRLDPLDSIAHAKLFQRAFTLVETTFQPMEGIRSSDAQAKLLTELFSDDIGLKTLHPVLQGAVLIHSFEISKNASSIPWMKTSMRRLKDWTSTHPGSPWTSIIIRRAQAVVDIYQQLTRISFLDETFIQAIRRHINLIQSYGHLETTLAAKEDISILLSRMSEQQNAQSLDSHLKKTGENSIRIENQVAAHVELEPSHLRGVLAQTKIWNGLPADDEFVARQGALSAPLHWIRESPTNRKVFSLKNFRTIREIDQYFLDHKIDPLHESWFTDGPRLLIIAGRIRTHQPLSTDDLKFIKYAINDQLIGHMSSDELEKSILMKNVNTILDIVFDFRRPLEAIPESSVKIATQNQEQILEIVLQGFRDLKSRGLKLPQEAAYLVHLRPPSVIQSSFEFFKDIREMCFLTVHP